MSAPPSFLHGILLLDKPLGLSSQQALHRVKRALGAHKAGHTGSLDPLATGMLPCCLGEATKLAGYLLGERKKYAACIALGRTTTTADREGAVLEEKPVPVLDDDGVARLLRAFVGRIRQKPPMYSAIKKAGVPLYRLARRGQSIDVPERSVDIYGIELQRRSTDELWIEVECGSGTYIRSLAEDIGRAIGCGAHLGALRRLWVKPFERHEMIELEQVEREPRALVGHPALLPAAAAVADWHKVAVTAQEAHSLRQGKRLQRPNLGWSGQCAAFCGDELVALAQCDPQGTLSTQRVFVWGPV